MRFFAPAKLNLSLDLGPTRGDGYHEIRSVMQAVSLGDRLLVVPAKSFRLHNPAVEGPDLVVRAAEVFRRATGVEPALAISVGKRIPIGAGLGGGSSDAASALRAMRGMLLPSLPVSELAAMAREIGSDVPFFLGPAPRALAVGRGETLSPLPAAAPRYVLIAWPGVPLSTAAVYRESAAGKGDGTDRVLSGAELAPNDLEPAALRLCPELQALLREAAGAGISLRVTGSGSAAFALHGNGEDAMRGLSALRRLAPRAILCQTLERWPWQGLPAAGQPTAGKAPPPFRGGGRDDGAA